MKEKIKKIQKGFIQIPLLIGIIVFVAVASGAGYGAIEYKKASNLLKEAGQLTKEEKYTEAKEKLELVQNSWLVKNLGVKKQEVNNKIEENKKLEEDRSKYTQGLEKFNNDNLQGAIDLLSELPEKSFYYQKAQTKIEESKRKMLEGELSDEKIAREEAEEKTRQETTAKKVAEEKARQEEIIRKAREGDLAAKEAQERMMNADNDKDGLTYREELAKGTFDYNPDSDGDGIIDSLDTHPAGGGRNIAQTFAWSYGGYNWTWTEYIQEDWYDYYKAKKPRPDPRSAEYVTYNDPFIQKISKRISEAANEKGINKDALAEAFVQNLSYVDDVYTGYDEYPKYPVETFFEKNGDCEDTSYLAASIVRAMDIDTVLIVLPEHMAIGVWMDCGSAGTYYELNGRCYYYTETTGDGWLSGEIPDNYRYTSAALIKIPSGETINNISQGYKKPCYSATDFPGYYYDGKNYYSDSQCNNLAYCLPYQGYYVNSQMTDLFWDSSCSQIVVKGCSKSTTYSGYFTNGTDYYSDSSCTLKANFCRPSPNYTDTYYDGYYEYWDSSCSQIVVSGCYKSTTYSGYFSNSIDLYSDSRCIQKATICRSSPNYSDTYYNGYNEFWDINCTQRVTYGCSKSTYHPGYFFSSLSSEYYYDSQCTQKADL